MLFLFFILLNVLSTGRHDDDPFFMFLSRTQAVASWSYSLASHIGIYGVLGFQKGKDIVFSERVLSMGKMVSLVTYSAEYLRLRYRTLLLDT